MTNEDIFKAGIALVEQLIPMEARILANDTTQSILTTIELERRCENFVKWCGDAQFLPFFDKYVETHQKTTEFIYTLKSIHYAYQSNNQED